MAWRDGRLTWADLTASVDGPVRVRVPEGQRPQSVSGGAALTPAASDPHVVTLQLAKGRTYRIAF